jgi:hypothetical protein
MLWHIYSLLGNDRETNNDTMIFAMQQLRKEATVLEPLLNSGSSSTMEVLLEAVFSMWSGSRLYHSTYRLELVRTVSQLVNQSRVAVAEAGESAVTQSKGTSAVGSRYRTTAMEG